MKELLKKFCTANGVSGFEKEIFDFILQEISDYADEIYFDKIGNLIAFKKGEKQSRNKILYAAHADEVGLIITDIEEGGSLKFDAVGIDKNVLLGKRVLVGEKKIPGVIASKPIHLLKKEEREKPAEIEGMYIDIGAESKDEAESLGVFASFAVFDSEFETVGRKIKAKAIDDRLGCAILCELMKSSLSHDTYFAFTVCEELGLRGAGAVAFDLKPDITVVVESTTASDIFGTPEHEKVCVQGNGAVVPFMDRATLYDRKLYHLAFETAKENGIPIQTKSVVSGGTDAGSYQRAGAGTKVLAVSVPCRYLHTGSCMIDMRDAESVRSLCFALSTILPTAELNDEKRG